MREKRELRVSINYYLLEGKKIQSKQNNWLDEQFSDIASPTSILQYWYAKLKREV